MIYVTIVFLFEDRFSVDPMGRRKSKKVKAAGRIRTPDPRTADQDLPESGQPESVDFGGLPKIDLKKNLGCG